MSESDRHVDYVTQVHVRTYRRTFPPGVTPEDCLGRTDRGPETECVTQRHRQIKADSLAGALPRVDLAELEEP